MGWLRVRIEHPLLRGRLIARENRFRARVRLDDREVAAHVPNSGRLSELFLPEQQVLLAEARAPHRVTDYDLLMVSLPSTLVSIDARLPNKLCHEAVEDAALPEFEGLSLIDREVSYGRSRLDFSLRSEDNENTCLVEVKSVTLVQAGIGRFPDAVTERGRRHLRELEKACRQGRRAAVVFVIQRDDACGFAPHDESDPAFGSVLREVASRGVEVYAYTCGVTPEEVVIRGKVPVHLDGEA
jgi:sugar fermentation stimulation protein A